jgi:hypothetical protein
MTYPPYRGIVKDLVVDGHPVQTLCNTRNLLDVWVECTHRRWPDHVIECYKATEELFLTVEPHATLDE